MYFCSAFSIQISSSKPFGIKKMLIAFVLLECAVFELRFVQALLRMSLALHGCLRKWNFPE